MSRLPSFSGSLVSRIPGAVQTASGHVLAHDVWITGKQAENNVIAEIGYGHNFPSKGTIPDRR
ncbi:hypothetical protein O3H73_29795, partial [Escherichia coli]|nr:hypothetical protein [Escherichia coli]MDA5292419.1 hypothetical protein [Escherichia coli]MDA5297943.1 hypothetical protein [Escherichia coli]MDA5303473.1 hypothetical protein [Escherichia coli]MDA5308993.1 hypothetical protein [Escherichia coli]